jgi:hypothetical protein
MAEIAVKNRTSEKLYCTRFIAVQWIDTVMAFSGALEERTDRR